MKFGSKEAESHPWGPAHHGGRPPQQDAQQGAGPIPLMGERPEGVGTLGRRGLQFQWKSSQRASRYSWGSRTTPGRSWLLFSHQVVSDSLWPQGLWHARIPCPSPALKLMSVKSVMLTNPLRGSQLCHGEGACVTQWSYGSCHAGPPKRVLTNRGPLRTERQTTPLFLPWEPHGHEQYERKWPESPCCPHGKTRNVGRTVISGEVKAKLEWDPRAGGCASDTALPPRPPGPRAGHTAGRRGPTAAVQLQFQSLKGSCGLSPCQQQVTGGKGRQATRAQPRRQESHHILHCHALRQSPVQGRDRSSKPAALCIPGDLEGQGRFLPG